MSTLFGNRSRDYIVCGIIVVKMFYKRFVWMCLYLNRDIPNIEIENLLVL